MKRQNERERSWRRKRSWGEVGMGRREKRKREEELNKEDYEGSEYGKEKRK